MAKRGATTAALLGATLVLLLAGLCAASTTPPTAKYLGCFYNTDYCALPTALNIAGTTVTLEECQALAAAATPVQPLYGVSSGQCYGGTRLLAATSVGRAQDLECTDGSNSDAIGIYQLVPPNGPIPLGCLADETALPDRMAFDITAAAVFSQAKATAASRNARYFAVARSADSGYGYTFDAEPRVAPVLNFTIDGSLGCYAPCADDAAKACGSAGGYGDASLQRVWFVYEVPSCTTVDACGPECVKCPEVTFGTRVCEVSSTDGHMCGVQCIVNFNAVKVNGSLSCVPRFSTGLALDDNDRLKSPLNCSRRGAVCTGRRTPGNLQAPLTVEELAQQACGLDSIDQPDCIERLWMMLLPESYNSNATTDTPRGNRLVRPAQDQGSCGSCAAFAATAAAEAAIAAYKNWNWNRISLSEQDLSFCRLWPTLSCTFGASFVAILGNMIEENVKRITKWASRGCYKYTGIPANGECRTVAKNCTSVLPPDALLSPVADGNQLDTEARVKRQIMQNGGVMAAVEIPNEFYNYPRSSTVEGDIYTDPPTLQPGQLGSPHALFCYGWKDFVNSTNSAPAPSIDGYWLCKNSWGTGWGLGGNVKLAYGAAGFLDRLAAYGLQFRPAGSVQRDDLTELFKRGLSYDKQNSSCLLFTPQQRMRLATLVEDLHSLTLAVVSGNPMGLAQQVILGDIVAANLGNRSLSAASKGPFRLCGETYRLVAGLVPLPPKPVDCSDVPFSVKASNGSCACTKPPFTIPGVQGSQLRECLSSQAVASNCPVKYPTAVTPPAGVITTCITDATPCPSKFMPLYSGDPIRRRRCQPKQQSCTTPGFTVALAETSATAGYSRNPRPGKCASLNCVGRPTVTSVNYIYKVLGCVSDTARRCPDGYVGFMSPSAAGTKDLKLELCTKTAACYTGSVEKTNRTVTPAKFRSYGTAGYDAGEFVACLQLDGGACPPHFPKQGTVGDWKVCST